MTVLALLGPTASGKSDAAIQIVRRRTASGWPTEIVAVDAFTIYRGMDIATAKPPPEIREQIPHHLVDVVEPAEEISVATFQRMARAAISDVRRRGATPLLVGGSGLYWRAAVDDLAFAPTDATVRARFEAAWSADPAAAHQELARRDPRAAERIDPENLRRTVRALEVIELTGRPFSAFHAAWDDFVSIYPGLHVAYLEPDTGDLRRTIADRARAMVAAGLLDEAQRLRAQAISRTARQAIGYAEAFAVLDGTQPADGLAEAIATRTWRYARRQRSWFRADPRCSPESSPQAIARLGGLSPTAQHDDVDGARDVDDIGQ